MDEQAKQFAESVLEDLASTADGDMTAFKKLWKNVKKIVDAEVEKF